MSARAVGLVVASLAVSTAQARPDRPGSDLFTFDVGDEIFTQDSEHFRVHYSVAGTHAVPVADVDTDGVPDHVEAVIALYEDVLATTVGMGFRAPVSDAGLPDNGGDARFDVYLVDFGRNADGAYRAEVCRGAICSGYMVHENDFVGYNYPSVVIANRTVASHEFFHAVQAAYDNDQGPVIGEGTAVWASERFDASLRDLEGFAYGYLDNAATPLDAGRGGPVDRFTYGAGIFFQYLTERFDNDVVRDLWESVADDVAADADWFVTIDSVLRARASSFAEAFVEFSTWTLFTGERADAAQSFENGAQMVERDSFEVALPYVQERFTVFTASSRLLSVPVLDSDSVFFSVGAATANDVVTVFALPLRADGTPLDLTAIVDANDSVDVEDATDLLVLVINARQQDGAARPHLCIGDRAEVDACIGSEGEGEGEGEGEPDGPDDVEQDGGGCGATSSSPWGAAITLLLLTLGRRRGVIRRAHVSATS